MSDHDEKHLLKLKIKRVRTRVAASVRTGSGVGPSGSCQRTDPTDAGTTCFSAARGITVAPPCKL